MLQDSPAKKQKKNHYYTFLLKGQITCSRVLLSQEQHYLEQETYFQCSAKIVPFYSSC